MTVKSADVAEHAGVSRATVSQVLNGHEDRFAPETVQKVLDSAKELGYQPSAAARTLRRGTSDFVIALVPFTSFGTNLQDIFEGMTRTFAEHGYNLILRMATSDTSSLRKLITDLKPAGVFSIAPFSAAERELFEQHGVLAIDPPGVAEIDHNQFIGELQAKMLIEHGYQHLAFAHLKDARNDPYGDGREQGVRNQALAAGFGDIEVIETGIDLAAGVAALQRLKADRVGVACYNDDVALTLLSAAHTLGLNVPADIALIGMDGVPLSQVSIPRLTTLEYDLEAAIAYATAGLLESFGAGEALPAVSPAMLRVIDGETI